MRPREHDRNSIETLVQVLIQELCTAWPLHLWGEMRCSVYGEWNETMETLAPDPQPQRESG